DGSLADGPIALCEIQAYAYAARIGAAELAELLELPERATELRLQAEELRQRFEDAYWLEELGTYALALDGDKRPTQVRTSNPGHCLVSGIVAPSRAAQLAETLMDDASFSGWGVRTVAAGESRYNPMSYHNGSIWPHDNAIVAAGLMRYGCVDAAQRVATALFDAAERLGGQLPELFCGFDRSEFTDPVPYPTACSPQAWASASPQFLLRTLLRFDPWIPFGRVWCAPAVPDRYLPLRIESLHLAGAEVTIDVRRDDWSLSGLPEGIELVRAPRQPLTATTPPPLTEPTKNVLVDSVLPS
ncbi:MAG: amylo-alpha-1,6-glucosidase, partial [Pseudonocardiaceae bacterium]